MEKQTSKINHKRHQNRQYTVNKHKNSENVLKKENININEKNDWNIRDENSGNAEHYKKSKYK